MENNFSKDLKKNPKAPEKNLKSNGYMAGGAPIFIFRNSKVGALLLHSFTSAPYEMKEMAEYLADRDITVYAPPLAGHGTCPDDLAKTDPADWQKSAEDAYLFLKEKVEKIYVIGSSFGGNLAFHLATKFNNPLGGVVSLGTPISVRWQKVFKAAIYSYGWLKKYHRKSKRDYRLFYNTSEMEQVVYPVIPVKSLRDFFKFLKKFKTFSLKEVISPTLIIQSNTDSIVNPKSAQYLHQHLGSNDKKIYWANGTYHALAIDEKRYLIFRMIYRFITNGNGNEKKE